MKLSKLSASLLILLVAFVVLVGSLSAVQSRMNAIRIDQELTDTEPLENAPPLVAFTTVALGGFRGLVADFLWLRSQRMQDLGNYFETVQLASWITKLQPRFTAASSYLAWNMAYNVSVTFSRPEDRWRWVQRGIELIRDEALNYNPSDPELFQQLGWIYQHKLGKDLDDANRYYKTQMAWEMIRVFGPLANRWDIISQGALTPAKLEAHLGEEDYAEFMKILARKGWTFDDFERAFRDSPDGRIPADVAKELAALSTPQKDVVFIVDVSLRHRWLRNHYRLRPEVIYQITQAFGELDWRLPQAHAIYWAFRGLREWSKSEDQFKALQCDRMIFQSLKEAFEAGRLVIYNKDDTLYLQTEPNLAVADVCRDYYRSTMKTHGDGTVRGAFGNFMVDAVVYFYKFGQRTKAKEYFDEAKKEFTSRFKGDLDTFALAELEEDIKIMSYNQAQSTVEGFIVNSCYGLAIGNTEDAIAYERTARRVYNKYQKDIKGTEKRRTLPPYEQIKRTMIERCLKTFPPELSAALKAALDAEKAAEEEKAED
jgi:tetratricopeptide (TPR) repeat protein